MVVAGPSTTPVFSELWSIRVRIINIFGAPGAGKSTACLGLSYELKRRWIATEYVPEFAKDLVWRGSAHLLKHQLYVFAEQQLRIDCLEGQTDIAVCDSPLLLSSFYSPEEYPLPFKQAVFEFFDHYDNLNFFIRRSHAYVAPGRIQTEEQSDRLAESMQEFLYQTGVPFYTITASDDLPRHLLWWLEKEGMITSNNAKPLPADYRPPSDWALPQLHHRTWPNGAPKRSMAAIARYYLDKDIPTVGEAGAHPSGPSSAEHPMGD